MMRFFFRNFKIFAEKEENAANKHFLRMFSKSVLVSFVTTLDCVASAVLIQQTSFVRVNKNTVNSSSLIRLFHPFLNKPLFLRVSNIFFSLENTMRKR